MEEKNKNEVLGKGIATTGVVQTDEELEAKALEMLENDEMLNELNEALLEHRCVHNLTEIYNKYCYSEHDREKFKKDYHLNDYLFALINKYKHINFYFLDVISANSNLYLTDDFCNLEFYDEKDKMHAEYIKQYIRLQNKFFAVKNARELYEFARLVRKKLLEGIGTIFKDRLKDALFYFDYKEIKDKIVNLRAQQSNNNIQGMCYFVRLFWGDDQDTQIGVSIRCRDLRELAQCIQKLSEFENIPFISYEPATDEKSIELFIEHYRKYHRFAKRFVRTLYLCDLASLDDVIQRVVTNDNEVAWLFWGEAERKRIREQVRAQQ